MVTYVLPFKGRGVSRPGYVRGDGSTPFGSWFDRLDHHAAAKVATAVARVSAGNTSNIKWFSGIGEISIDLGPGYRVYLAKDGESLICCSPGGAKKRQQADIETALALHAGTRGARRPRRRRRDDNGI